MATGQHTYTGTIIHVRTICTRTNTIHVLCNIYTIHRVTVINDRTQIGSVIDENK